MKIHRNVRIYETLPEMIDPSHTCLVVWDVQNALVARVFDHETYVARLAPFLSALRGRMRLIYTMITPAPTWTQTGWNLFGLMRRLHLDDPGKLDGFLPKGSPEREIPAELAPQADDLVIEKSTQSIFLGTHFEAVARSLGVHSIIFTGIATEIGIETCARDAGARGFYPVVVSDAVSSPDRNAHERSLQSLARVAIVASMDEIRRALPSR